MSKKKRYSSEEKFQIVKEVLSTEITVSEACKKYGISTANFYNWQKIFLESAFEGFNKSKLGRPETQQKKQIENLAEENKRMKEVIAEIVSENIDLKKNLSE